MYTITVECFFNRRELVKRFGHSEIRSQKNNLPVFQIQKTQRDRIPRPNLTRMRITRHCFEAILRHLRLTSYTYTQEKANPWIAIDPFVAAFNACRTVAIFAGRHHIYTRHSLWVVGGLFSPWLRMGKITVTACCT